MPFYTYHCPDHGAFDKRAGYNDAYTLCICGEPSVRQAVYGLSFVMEGRSMPRRDDVYSTQEEYHKEIKKRGWSADRAVTELRTSKFVDNEGQLRINTATMTQEA